MKLLQLLYNEKQLRFFDYKILFKNFSAQNDIAGCIGFVQRKHTKHNIKTEENPTRFSTTYIGVWGIPKRFKGVKGSGFRVRI